MRWFDIDKIYPHKCKHYCENTETASIALKTNNFKDSKYVSSSFKLKWVYANKILQIISILRYERISLLFRIYILNRKRNSID